ILAPEGMHRARRRTTPRAGRRDRSRDLTQMFTQGVTELLGEPSEVESSGSPWPGGAPLRGPVPLERIDQCDSGTANILRASGHEGQRVHASRRDEEAVDGGQPVG